MKKEIKTLKAARENGYKLREKWIYFNKYPKIKSEPLRLKGHELYHEKQCEIIASKNWFKKEHNREVISTAKPVAEKATIKFGKITRFDVYRISDTKPIKKSEVQKVF